MNYSFLPILYQREEKKITAKIGLALLVIMLVPAIIQLAAAAAVYRLFPQTADSTAFNFFLAFVPQYLIAYPLAVCIFHRSPKCRIHESKLGKKEKYHYFFICYFALMLGSLLSSGIGKILEHFFHVSTDLPIDELLGQFNLATVLFLAVILAPIVEELIFRKLLLDRLVKYGELPAVITSGLIFGLCHGNFSQFFYAMLIGWVFAYIYVKTGKIRYSIIMHMIINFLGSVLPLYIAQNNNYILFAVYLLCSLTFIVLGAVYCISYRKKWHFEPSDYNLSTKEAFKIIWLNRGMVLAILVFITFFLASLLV